MRALEARHIVAISGARRSGKSYLFRQIIQTLLNTGVDPSYTDEPNEREMRGLEEFAAVAPAKRYIVVTRDRFDRIRQGGILVEMIPFWVFMFLPLEEL